MENTQGKGGKVSADEGGFHFRPYRPERSDKLPPCRAMCPSGTPVRDWIAEIAQGPHDPAGREGSYKKAWRLLVASNPFPATMGRICPHPCEAECNREDLEGAVAISALERYLGDRAIAEGWSLPIDEDIRYPESIGVIGAGPAGLSFAYQMRRRGYPVTVYERHPKAGGMLRFGVPDFRLPPAVLDAELKRIFDSGITLVAPVRVGVEISVLELQSLHRVLFLGFGAQAGRHLGIPGEAGDQVWTGVDFLELANSGAVPALGDQVVVIGGGNTAIDAARVARRNGAAVTLVYRRCREDMPAIPEEVDAAREEGVETLFLATPIELIRSDTGTLTGVRLQRLQVTGTDSGGRSEVRPGAGEIRTILASSLISAVSQESDWVGLEGLTKQRDEFIAGELKPADELICCSGGDLTGLDLASHAIGQGRASAEAVHARLRQLVETQGPTTAEPKVQADHYPGAGRLSLPSTPVAERLSDTAREESTTISEKEFLQEISRCLSCGLCNGCDLCWMYCGGNGFTRLESPRPGQYFAFSTDECSGCGKCIELCPTGYISEAR